MAALGSTPLGAGDLIGDLGENLLLPERPLRVALSGSIRQLSVSLLLPLEDRVRQQIELNLASGVYVYHFDSRGGSPHQTTSAHQVV